jgi:phage terminase Nu1 subunit (DNA packaging protein)
MGKRVNRNELAEIFDVSLPTVSAWLGAGMPVLEQGRKGREYAFDAGEVRKWLEDRAVSATQGDMSKLSLEEIRKRTGRRARSSISPVSLSSPMTSAIQTRRGSSESSAAWSC